MQHAEHYIRMLSEAQRELGIRPDAGVMSQPGYGGYDDTDRDESPLSTVEDDDRSEGGLVVTPENSGPRQPRQHVSHPRPQHPQSHHPNGQHSGNQAQPAAQPVQPVAQQGYAPAQVDAGTRPPRPQRQHAPMRQPELPRPDPRTQDQPDIVPRVMPSPVVVVAPAVAPVAEAPAPTPKVEAPAPKVEAAAPMPEVGAAVPTPRVEAPVAAPVVEAAAPATVVEVPATPPVEEAAAADAPAPRPRTRAPRRRTPRAAAKTDAAEPSPVEDRSEPGGETLVT